MKFNHVEIPTRHTFDGEIALPHLQMTVSDHLNNPFGIQWQRYWDGAPHPDLVKTVAHLAFEVDDLLTALEGHRVIIEPNSPSRSVTVAFIEVNGAPVEAESAAAHSCSVAFRLTRHLHRLATIRDSHRPRQT
jgi:hypothetical protein